MCLNGLFLLLDLGKCAPPIMNVGMQTAARARGTWCRGRMQGSNAGQTGSPSGAESRRNAVDDPISLCPTSQPAL